MTSLDMVVHQENLALFKKRLADEEAKEPLPKNGILKPR
jgi:hypothetical protein